jgi:hypothetical protein
LLEQCGRRTFRENLLSLTGTNEETVAHTDTVNVFLEQLAVEYLEALKCMLIKELIRAKRLDKCRLDGEFLIAVDMTGIYKFDLPHCDQCLTQDHDGTMTYHHMVLEAKLVTAGGMALSVCTEYVENADPTDSKQDCELKALYRLHPKLKAAFPHTRICLLLDSLYACRQVLAIAREHHWSFFITFTSEKIPTLWEDAQRQLKHRPRNQQVHHPDQNTTQRFRWCTNLQYAGHTLHAVFCEEDAIEDGKPVTRNFAWLTDLRPSKSNVAKLANKGGRLRWKIENQGFDDQKKHGFELEHAYGRQENAWKNYYQLLQIAHLISQLITKSDICPKLQKLQVQAGAPPGPIADFSTYYPSIKGFVRQLRASFTLCAFFAIVFAPAAKRIQLRLPETERLRCPWASS